MSKERTIRIVKAILNGSYQFSPRLSGWLTYQVLVRPPHHVAEPEEEAFVAQAQPSFIQDEELQLAAFHWPGKGPKVLLVHGWDSYSGRWYPVAERLQAAGYDLYAFDAPAHGRTSGGTFSVLRYAQSLAKVMHKIAPAIVIGHSAGGMAAVYHYQLYPQGFRPKGMVLLGVPGELTDFIESFRSTLGLSPRTINALDAYFAKVWGHPLAFYSTSHFAQDLQMPGLVIHDEADDVAPFTGAQAIVNNWPQAHFLATTGYGHSLQAPQVWEAIVDFCQSVQVKR